MKYIIRKDVRYDKYAIFSTRYKAEKAIKEFKEEYPELEFIKHKERLLGKDKYVIYARRKGG